MAASVTVAASAGDNKPYSGTNYFPSAFSLNTIPSLDGLTAVVTGGNSGIGFETSKHLALNGARVIITCRSSAKAQDSIAKIEQAVNEVNRTARIEFIVLDLADLEAVKVITQHLPQDLKSIDILVCNAGIFNLDANFFQVSPSSGLESMFAVNHLGHFFLTLQLMPLILASSSPRIVMVSSYGTWRAPLCGIDFDSLTVRNPSFTSRHYYGQSKLANMLFAAELNRRYGHQVYVNSVHPGNVATEMTRDLFASAQASIYTNILSAEQGAIASLFAAVSPDIVENGVKCSYIIPFGVVSTDHNPIANDVELSKRLWEFSESILSRVLE
ncbi:NAD(P)-binding protein [Rhizoclosmatium globosum]|uniref:NAD(P)-binding protein n=1 Tax=Rhizoclosmatium globosum TaxID=329046 RepID=A0A1Y2C1X4_9FUNG|nr:NAD(P)-binding protein [Rhizoclosmatium globosum]|eukprot:ORY41043.1 NAD(P)-binding protein [Rhizoclosmatium globosum]